MYQNNVPECKSKSEMEVDGSASTGPFKVLSGATAKMGSKYPQIDVNGRWLLIKFLVGWIPKNFTVLEVVFLFFPVWKT